jgi:uncharacterized membrane protein
MTIEHTIHIEVPPEVVWAVTEDVERWPEWTPTVTAARRLDKGAFGPGSVFRIKQPGQPESDWTVTEFVRGRRFTWETRRPGLRMAATHVMSADAAGTVNTLRVETSGIMAVVLWPVLWPAVRYALKQENIGLKARCEALAASRPPA